VWPIRFPPARDQDHPIRLALLERQPEVPRQACHGHCPTLPARDSSIQSGGQALEEALAGTDSSGSSKVQISQAEELVTILVHLSPDQIKQFSEEGDSNMLDSWTLQDALKKMGKGIRKIYPPAPENIGIRAIPIARDYENKMKTLKLQAKAFKNRLESKIASFVMCLAMGFAGGAIFVWLLQKKVRPVSKT